MPVHLINSKQIGVSEQLWDDQKIPYYVPSLTVHYQYKCLGGPLFQDCEGTITSVEINDI